MDDSVADDLSGLWIRYGFKRNTTGQGSTIEKVGRVELSSLPPEILGSGEVYFMEDPEIHRVGFTPDLATGWTVILFYEFRDQIAAPYAYSTPILPTCLKRKNISKKHSQKELEGLVERFVEVLNL